VAGFAVAAAEFIKSGAFNGSISLLITGDEEGPAVNGTVKVLEWMKEHGHVPDVCLVGEPTNPSALGQEVKIGRRGSLNGYLTVNGTQGHVAYPHLAENPLPGLIEMLGVLSSHVFDEGTEFFAPTNLEITTIDVGNPATNVIPAQGRAEFNIRFNDTWTRQSLQDKILELLQSSGRLYEIEFEGNAESFITQPGAWSEIVQNAVCDVTGKVPECTTSGGTSDARFIVDYCPVIECGAINASIHQIDENAAVEDLEKLTKIYGRILERYFS
jgi:succinyl-diaminopimelate desuccinylase